MTVRAKFRCLAITSKYDGGVIAALAPVKRKGRDPENDDFWKYSPNGECELHYHRQCPIKIGAYYYVDATRVDDAVSPELWELSRRDENNSYVNVEFSWYLRRADYGLPPPPGLISGSLKIGLSEDAVGARAALQPVRSFWHLAFTFAEDSDG